MIMWTRRHYEATAQMIHEEYVKAEDGVSMRMLENLAEAFADMYRRDNARFDRNRFSRACFEVKCAECGNLSDATDRDAFCSYACYDAYCGREN